MGVLCCILGHDWIETHYKRILDGDFAKVFYRCCRCGKRSYKIKFLIIL